MTFCMKLEADWESIHNLIIFQLFWKKFRHKVSESVYTSKDKKDWLELLSNYVLLEKSHLKWNQQVT